MSKIATPYDDQIILDIKVRKDMNMLIQSPLPPREVIKILHTIVVEMTFKEVERLTQTETTIIK